MTPNDIQVGKIYVNSIKNQKYLGIGLRKMWEGTFGNKDSNFEEKRLVIIEGNPEYIGLIVQSPENCSEEYWDDFRLDNS